MDKSSRQVKRRNETFTNRQVTKIWHEVALSDNPYVATSSSCHGYDMNELMRKRSFVEVFFLLFQATLPDKDQAELLETLMVALINPGPRHPSTRAAMNASIGKTDPTHILPISLGILGGMHLGAGEVEISIRFIRKHLNQDPISVVKSLLSSQQTPVEGDWHPAPGFGNRFSAIDELSHQVASHLLTLKGAGKCLHWGNAFATALAPHQMGWLTTGVAAAALADLNFIPQTGAGIFQILSAPGLLAHGLELANKPITAMPFPKDEDYIIEK